MNKIEAARTIVGQGGNCTLPVLVDCDNCPLHREAGCTVDGCNQALERARTYLAEHDTWTPEIGEHVKISELEQKWLNDRVFILATLEDIAKEDLLTGREIAVKGILEEHRPKPAEHYKHVYNCQMGGHATPNPERATTSTVTVKQACTHPEDQRQPYHDNSIVCDVCNSVIEQDGKTIDPPAYLGMDLPTIPQASAGDDLLPADFGKGKVRPENKAEQATLEPLKVLKEFFEASEHYHVCRCDDFEDSADNDCYGTYIRARDKAKEIINHLNKEPTK